MTAPGPRGSPLQRAAARAVLRRLDALSRGRLEVEADGGRWAFGEPDADLRARVAVRDPRFWTSVALRGGVGAGESYARGHWDADDLTAVVRLLVRNEAALQSLRRGWARVSAPFLALGHLLRPNTRAGARRNVMAHYDLGNDWFALFLDPTMTYSCAVYEREGMGLEEAQVAKMERICRKLRLGPDVRLLEIGSGWGGLAVHAAARHGCRVTTTTISPAQHAAAVARVRAAGLEDRVEVLLSDYRDLRGTWDRLVSVEMIEAVGHRHYDDYFGAISRALAPGGLACLQAIVIEDRSYDRARRSVDFIRRHVFPGSCIPSVGAIAASVARATDLRWLDLEDLTPHYVTTLEAWRANLRARAAEARALGRTDEDLRLWEFYFSYCAGGFAERRLGDVQILFQRA